MFILNTGFPPEPRWTRFSFQQDISLPELSHKHLWGVGGDFIIKSILESSFFSVLQVCSRMPLGAEWMWLSLNQTIAAFRRKSLRKLPLKLAVCCASTPASLHRPLPCPELREVIQTQLCTHNMRGEIWNQNSLTQIKMNNILYFYQPEICLWHHQ